jgi:hypothetical protein
MSRAPTKSAQTMIPMSPAELEALIRRVVREAISQLVQQPQSVAVTSPSQEGQEDPAGDQQLLVGALAVLEHYGDKPEAWTDWETFKAELKEAEAAGEIQADTQLSR